MNWKETIRIGMEMMKAGCNRNDSTDNCPKCPFSYYCFVTTVDDNKGICPKTFFEEEKEDV